MVFLNTYNELYNEELRSAYENKDKRLHDVLVELDVSPELLLEQLIQRSSKVAADMVELMRFDRYKSPKHYLILPMQSILIICALLQS